MSLQIWLPLLGNINNQGLASSEITSNTLTYGNGPLGSSATFSNNYVLIKDTPIVTGVNEFSFAFWYSTTSTNAQCLYNGRTNVGSAIAIFNIGSKIRFDDGSQRTFNYTIPSDGTWHHYAIVRGSADVKLYVDGALSQTMTSAAFTCTATYASIGTSSVNTASPSGNNLIGSLCDYRIYDHCLSTKEVKEISKGLSIHLPLKPLNANPNLVPNSQTWNNSFLVNGAASGITRTVLNYDGVTVQRFTANADCSYGFYTSCFSGRRWNNSAYTWSMEIRGNTNFTIPSIGHERFGWRSADVTTEWKKISGTGAYTPGSYTAFVMYFNSTTQFKSGNWIEIKNFKVEEGSEATPWCPNIYDTEYTRLGYGTRTLPYTFAGSPTNNLGYISNFSTTNYINTGYTLNPGSNPWEVTTRLTTGTDITTQQYIEGCMGIENNYGILFGTTTDSKTVLWISSAGVSWDIANGVKGLEVAASTTYWFKYGFDGSKYYLKRSTDGGNTYTTEIEVESTTAIKAMAFYLGSCWDKAKPFKGAIDMDKFSIIVNKNLVYTGAPIYGNNFVLQDRSGYNRVTTMQGRLTPVSAPTGLGTNFTMAGRITCDSGFPTGTQPPFTIAFWHKPNDCTYTQWSDVCGTSVGTASSTSFGGYFRLEVCNTRGSEFKWFGNGYVTDGGGTCGSTPAINVWRHVVLTFDGTTFRQYVNGTQVSTATLASAYEGFKTYGRFYVGDAGMYIDMSDCRVYGTCLSAEDVKALYNTPIAIDKTGKLYCREIAEEDSIKYKKTGEFKGIPNEGNYDKLSLCKNGNVNTPDIYEI